MTIDDKIRNEKLQYDINREETKILALLSGKIDKCEYLTGEEMLPSNQRQIIEQAKFTYSPLGKALGKQTKTIEEEGKKQIDAITNQNQNDDHKDDYKTVFEGLVKERFDEIKQLTHEINQNYLIYYFKSNTSSKRFDGFNNSTELFKKMK